MMVAYVCVSAPKCLKSGYLSNAAVHDVQRVYDA